MAMTRVPLFDRKILDWRDMLDAGIVDEHVHAAKRPLGKRDHVGDFHRLDHIRGRIDSLHPEIVLDCSPRFFDIGRCPNPVEHDVGASTRECPRIRQTDAARRAGHNCDFTFQNIHFAFPC